MKMKVRIMDMKLHEDAIHRGPAQVYPAIREAIKGAMVSGKACMFEPVQELHRQGLPGPRYLLTLITARATA